MALFNVYTLYDVKAQQYNQPFYFPNHALARRATSELVIDLTTTVGRHPADFKLYYLGHYHDDTGAFELLPVMEHIVDCVALLPPPHPDMFSKPNSYAGHPTHGPASNGSAR